MISTYIRLAWRSLSSNKIFSFINIAGLAIGMACTMLILLWVYNEHSWDSFQRNPENVHQLMITRAFNGQKITTPDFMFPLADAMKSSFPEIEAATMTSWGENTLFTVGEKRIRFKSYSAMPDFFKVFDYQFVDGTPTVMNDANALIISENMAKAIFGTTSNVIGKEIEINNTRTGIVKAIIKNTPVNSTLQFDCIIPFNPSAPNIREASTDWVNCFNQCFIKTKNGANIALLEKKIHELIVTKNRENKTTADASITLHAMTKWRLYSDFKDGVNVGGRIEYVKLFTWIAIIILIIACVNFMNLSTARSEKRAKEVGIRKTLGSQKSQLLLQFISESLLLAFISFLFALAIVYAALPMFTHLLAQQLFIPFNKVEFWTLGIAIVMFTGLLAGSYPALYLSKFNPIKVLKGTFLPGKQALLPRKILVTTQFIISIVLISATLIVYQQIQFVKKRELGYSPDQLLMVTASEDVNKNYNTIKNELLQSGYVINVNRSSNPITSIQGYTWGIDWKGKQSDKVAVIATMSTDEDFIKTTNATLLAGRDFRSGDSASVMLNKAAVALMGLESPIGRQIKSMDYPLTIVGIVDNMVMKSPYEPVDPMVIFYNNESFANVNIKVRNNVDMRAVISTIEQIFKKHNPEYPFEYRFADTEFNAKFTDEELVGKLSIVFASLTIFICCLGLFGLVAFSIERRKKEISIRKILGASVQSLLFLISKEFLTLVLLSFFVAMPIAWWSMNKWLQNYTYRIDINMTVFLLVGVIILVFTLVTVSLNASKAALTIPAKGLRSE